MSRPKPEFHIAKRRANGEFIGWAVLEVKRPGYALTPQVVAEFYGKKAKAFADRHAAYLQWRQRLARK